MVDPLAEVHYGLTPYNYVMNNLMNYRDSFGLDTVSVKDFSIKSFDTEKDVVALDEAVVSRSVSMSKAHRDLRLSARVLHSIDNIEYAGVVIDSDWESVEHYYKGSGESASIGRSSLKE